SQRRRQGRRRSGSQAASQSQRSWRRRSQSPGANRSKHAEQSSSLFILSRYLSMGLFGPDIALRIRTSYDTTRIGNLVSTSGASLPFSHFRLLQSVRDL